MEKNFLDRLLKFSVSVINLSNQLPKTPAWFAIASQFIRSGTSIGANVEEAQDASSTKDFVQKLSIALRKARETNYWLKIMQLRKWYLRRRQAGKFWNAGKLLQS